MTSLRIKMTIASHSRVRESCCYCSSACTVFFLRALSLSLSAAELARPSLDTKVNEERSRARLDATTSTTQSNPPGARSRSSNIMTFLPTIYTRSRASTYISSYHR